MVELTQSYVEFQSLLMLSPVMQLKCSHKHLMDSQGRVIINMTWFHYKMCLMVTSTGGAKPQKLLSA